MATTGEEAAPSNSHSGSNSSLSNSNHNNNGNGDLFAGLSMSSPKRSSPDKGMAVGQPLEVPKNARALDMPTQDDTEILRDHGTQINPVVLVTEAPTTDKLLSLLGTATATTISSSNNSMTAAANHPTPRAVIDVIEDESDAYHVVSESEVKEAKRAGGNESSEQEQSTPMSPTRIQSSSDAIPSTPSPKKRKPVNSFVPPVRVGVLATPVPSADVALRLLRKFASKTSPQIPQSFGGSKSLGIFGYLFGSSSKDDAVSLQPYADFMQIVMETETADGDNNNSNSSMENANKNTSTTINNEEADIIVESLMGRTGDTMSKAKLAVASFCHLLSVWCHASQACSTENNASGTTTTKGATAMDLLAFAIDSATALVAHGCLDHVEMQLPPERIAATATASDDSDSAPNGKDKKINSKSTNAWVVQLIVESIIVADLTVERTELAALKFLLTTGCRSSPDGTSLLRGQYLLQSIRVLYHVYLTTDYKANKTTARAALQQLVTSVFKRMLTTDMDNIATMEEDGFPSANHRDAFLVLRSMCKLSMRTFSSGVASGGNIAWDGGVASSGEPPASPKQVNGSNSSTSSTSGYTEDKIVVMPHSIHPALESKILALELLLYVLQNTDMSGNFLQLSGPQFQYAIRNYLCVSLLKNCTSDNTMVVNLSLRLFVPLIRNFRSHLKTEIEAFVTNVFFVILDSKHSTIEHKNLVVILFEEICSDPQTLAEIFLNYDCDLSAVDLFHRIVNTLARVARSLDTSSTEVTSMSFVAGAGAARMEKIRSEGRELRLEAMRALRQVLASLYASIVEPMTTLSASPSITDQDNMNEASHANNNTFHILETPKKEDKKTLVQIYDSKKKRRAEESEVVLRFNQKPSAGIKYAADCGHLDAKDPAEVAAYLLRNKDNFDKTQIGELLGREPQYQDGFSLKVLHEYVNMLDLTGMVFDDAIKHYLSGFRLPGEAQKIDRIMEKFAERYTSQNPTAFPTADAAFILAFSVIMLNTDLHNPSIKEDRRMTKEGFVRNNRGICDGQDLPEEMLHSIFDRIKEAPISLKEDDEARARVGDGDAGNSIQTALSPAVFFSSHYTEMDKDRENNFQKERDQIVRTTESLLRRKRGKDGEPKHTRTKSMNGGKSSRSVRFVRTEDTGLRDEYVAPMFEVTWGPALAAFSTAMESANGTVGALLAIATDEELEHAAENAAETIEVCLTGFRFAICTAGLCGNETARDAFMLALSRFTQLNAGTILEPRHVRCIQTLLALGKEDGELLGNTWEHVFKALSEVHRFHELFQLMARNDRAAAAAADRRRRKLEEIERRIQQRRERRRVTDEATDSGDDDLNTESSEPESGSETDDDIFSDDEEFLFEDEMDSREIDEANSRVVYDAVSEALIDAIYQRSASLSGPSIKVFVYQLCRVSRMEISGYGGHAGSEANTVDLTQTHYRQQHTLLATSTHGPDQGRHNQPSIYNLQKLVEVTHYNMDSRPRLVFADIWTTVAAHLTSTALHSNAAVAMYAVDSFRQLSIQYLQREELGGFEFQRKFLKSFEIVMAKSQHVSIKELLLKCIERIIMMFGSDDEEDGGSPVKLRGSLRSGWRPILAVLGLAGRDENELVAKMGFKMLTGQLRQCLAVEKDAGGVDRPKPGVLLAERFVDLVDALLMYVAGPHEEMSLVSIDHLVTLTTFLADDSFALPLVGRRTPHFAPASVTESNEYADSELELWWPILLGVSRSMGDPRTQVRLKSMVALLGIINTHFFPKNGVAENGEAPKHGELQTLQLIFRGILTPVLEHADSDTHLGPSPPLPDDFERFLTKPPPPLPKEERNATWLETTFEHFMDGCIAICMRSVEVFGKDELVEEIFAMLNSCTSSDSGGLAVRGLRRLQHFVTMDLDSSVVTDDTWATVCHMLRRCLAVRGLPQAKLSEDSDTDTTDAVADDLDAEFNESIREFVAEEKIMQDRRFIGSNVTMIIGSLLTNDEYKESMGLRWRLFLISGLGRGVKQWEEAGAILASHSVDSGGPSPPNYIENAIHGRKWMNKFILQLIVSNHSPDMSNQVDAQIKEQAQSLLTLFMEKEAALSPNGSGATKSPSWEATQLTRVTKLLYELVGSLDALDSDRLVELAWLEPMLRKCMESRNETVRKTVSKLQQKLIEVSADAKTEQAEDLTNEA